MHYDHYDKHKNEVDQDTCNGGEVCSNLTPLVGHRGLRLRMADLLSHRSLNWMSGYVRDACMRVFVYYGRRSGVHVTRQLWISMIVATE